MKARTIIQAHEAARDSTMQGQKALITRLVAQIPSDYRANLLDAMQVEYGRARLLGHRVSPLLDYAVKQLKIQ